MLMTNKFIVSDNGSLTDGSIEANDVNANSVVLAEVSAEDAFYVGAPLPFNHRYFSVSSANALASSLSVAVWNGKEFKAVVETNDQTASSGATLATSGVVSFVPDRREGWAREDTENILELSGVTMYGLYWAKFTFSGDLTAGTALNFSGWKFCDDNDLRKWGYPELLASNALAAFQSGKTDWEEQEVAASERIIDDLKDIQKLLQPNQILEWQDFSRACAHATAMIAYRSFGKDFKLNFDQAESDYRKAVDKAIPIFDQNRDARINDSELRTNLKVERR